jgi:hypothetical protein
MPAEDARPPVGNPFVISGTKGSLLSSKISYSLKSLKTGSGI